MAKQDNLGVFLGLGLIGVAVLLLSRKASTSKERDESGNGRFVYADSLGKLVKLRQAPYVDDFPKEGMEIPNVAFNTIAGEVPHGKLIGEYIAEVPSTESSQQSGPKWYKVRVDAVRKLAYGLEDDWGSGDGIYYVRTDVAKRGDNE